MISNDINSIFINNNETIKNIINNLFNLLDIIDIDNGIDKKLEKNNLLFILTSTKNQKKNEEKNNITINLNQCESILKKLYNISIFESIQYDKFNLIFSSLYKG